MCEESGRLWEREVCNKLRQIQTLDNSSMQIAVTEQIKYTGYVLGTHMQRIRAF
jgi:hypothetical protein